MGLQIRLESARCRPSGSKSSALFGRGHSLRALVSGSLRCATVAGGGRRGRLEASPNRDCLRYLAPNGLAAVRDFFRGPLRYPGWFEIWRSLSNLGLLDTEPLGWAGQSYGEFLNHYLGAGETVWWNALPDVSGCMGTTT